MISPSLHPPSPDLLISLSPSDLSHDLSNMFNLVYWSVPIWRPFNIVCWSKPSLCPFLVQWPILFSSVSLQVISLLYSRSVFKFNLICRSLHLYSPDKLVSPPLCSSCSAGQSASFCSVGQSTYLLLVLCPIHLSAVAVLVNPPICC